MPQKVLFTIIKILINQVTDRKTESIIIEFDSLLKTHFRIRHNKMSKDEKLNYTKLSVSD